MTQKHEYPTRIDGSGIVRGSGSVISRSETESGGLVRHTCQIVREPPADPRSRHRQRQLEVISMARKRNRLARKPQSEARYRRAITTADAQRTAARHGLPASTGAVLVALADHSNANRVSDGMATVWPKVETIAERVGLSVRMVRYHLGALKRAGLLVDVDHSDDTVGLVDRGRTRVRALVIDMFEAVTKSIAGLAGSRMHTAGKDTSYREDRKETRTPTPLIEEMTNPVPASAETRAASMAAIRAAINGRRERDLAARFTTAADMGI